MKLYSILVFEKASDGTARQLKSASDLSSFSFFQRSSVQEFMNFTGKLLVERTERGSRQDVKENDYLVHCHVRADGLAGVSVTDGEYQSRVAHTFINRALDEFAANVPPPARAAIRTEKDCAYNGLAPLLVRWQDPKTADPLTRVQEEIDETKVVLHSTITAVLERGEKLDDLVQKSEALSDSSKLFYTQARKMNKCCNYV